MSEQPARCERCDVTPTLCQHQGVFGNGRGGYTYCPNNVLHTLEQRRQRQWQEWPDSRRAHTFDHAKPDERLTSSERSLWQEALAGAKAFADGATAQAVLALGGHVGWGKTYLAECVMNYRFAHPEAGPVGMFVKVPDLLDKLRQSIRDDSVDDVISAYREIGLLVLDDLGAQKQTEKVDEWLYMIIDHRYEAAQHSDPKQRKQTIVTFNSAAKANVDPRILSRLSDTQNGIVLGFDYPNLRDRRTWK